MTRPIIGKMKVVVVPLNGDIADVSIEEYKEITGVDLRDVFKIDIPEQGEIGVYPKDNQTLILFSDAGQGTLQPYNLYEPISQINPGTEDAVTHIGYGIINGDGDAASGAGLEFRIDKNDYMSFDTLRIYTFEI